MIVRKTFVEWWDSQTEAFKHRNDFDACLKAFEAATRYDARYWYKAGKRDAIAKIKSLIQMIMGN